MPQPDCHPTCRCRRCAYCRYLPWCCCHSGRCVLRAARGKHSALRFRLSYCGGHQHSHHAAKEPIADQLDCQNRGALCICTIKAQWREGRVSRSEGGTDWMVGVRRAWTTSVHTPELPVRPSIRSTQSKRSNSTCSGTPNSSALLHSAETCSTARGKEQAMACRSSESCPPGSRAAHAPARSRQQRQSFPIGVSRAKTE